MTTTLIPPTADRPTATTTTEGPGPLEAGTAHQVAPAAPARTPVDRSDAAPRPPAAPAHSRTARLALSGDLGRADSSWLAPELDALAATGAAVVEIDLSAVTHLDGAVARLLLRTSWRLGDPSRKVLLLDPPTQVHRVLRWYGAGHLVPRRSRGRSVRRYPRAG